MSGEVNRQGQLDGLCGIYALTNFLRDLRIGNRFFSSGHRGKRSDDAFWMLLDAAYRLNMLTPDNLIEGLAAHQLAKIWNTLALEADLQVEAVLFSRLKRLGRGVTVSLIAECVHEENGPNALVILHREHWLLSASRGESGYVNVLDSAAANPRKRLSRAELDDSSIDGFALLGDLSKILVCIREEVGGA